MCTSSLTDLSGSAAYVIELTMQAASTPVVLTSAKFDSFMPPIATTGRLVLDLTSTKVSLPTGFLDDIHIVEVE